MEEGFFRKATAAEHDAVVKNEKKLSVLKFLLGFSVIAVILILIGYVFNKIVNTSLPFSSFREHRMQYAFIFLPVLVFFLIWLIVVSRKHMNKIKSGDYVVQTVMILGSSPDGKGIAKTHLKVTFVSEEGLIYIADFSSLGGKEMQDKAIGLLVMLNVKGSGILDEYRFIPISEYNPDFTQKSGAFSMRGTKPVFDPRKNKLDPRNNKPKNKTESTEVSEEDMKNGIFTIHPDSDTVIDHRLNKITDRNEPDDFDTF